MIARLSLNLRHLRAVAAIAEQGSLSGAALAIGLSQPALTQGLGRLEEQIGTSLFERRPDGMRPTAAGTILATRTGEAMAELARVMRSAGRVRGFAMPERLLTAAQLRAFLALAECGGFRPAAAATGIAEPSLHRAVRDVERLVGAPLVERQGRGVTLTERGRRVARGMRLAAAAIGSALVEIDMLVGAGGGTVAIGAMPLARARLLPAALATWCAAYPNARVTVVEGAHRELLDLLRDGRIDLMVGALRHPAPGAEVTQMPLCADRLAVVARAGHPLAGQRDIDAAALAGFPWIVGLPGSPIRDIWARMFAEDDAPPPTAPIDCGSVMTIRGLLLGGDYLTLLSPDQVWVELEAGLLALIGSAVVPASRTIGVTTRSGWRPTGEQRELVAALVDAAHTLSQNL